MTPQLPPGMMPGPQPTRIPDSFERPSPGVGLMLVQPKIPDDEVTKAGLVIKGSAGGPTNYMLCEIIEHGEDPLELEGFDWPAGEGDWILVNFALVASMSLVHANVVYAIIPADAVIAHVLPVESGTEAAFPRTPAIVS